MLVHACAYSIFLDCYNNGVCSCVPMHILCMYMCIHDHVCVTCTCVYMTMHVCMYMGIHDHVCVHCTHVYMTGVWCFYCVRSLLL